MGTEALTADVVQEVLSQHEDDVGGIHEFYGPCPVLLCGLAAEVERLRDLADEVRKHLDCGYGEGRTGSCLPLSVQAKLVPAPK